MLAAVTAMMTASVICQATSRRPGSDALPYLVREATTIVVVDNVEHLGTTLDKRNEFLVRVARTLYGGDSATELNLIVDQDMVPAIAALQRNSLLFLRIAQGPTESTSNSRGIHLELVDGGDSIVSDDGKVAASVAEYLHAGSDEQRTMWILDAAGSDRPFLQKSAIIAEALMVPVSPSSKSQVIAASQVARNRAADPRTRLMALQFISAIDTRQWTDACAAIAIDPAAPSFLRIDAIRQLEATPEGLELLRKWTDSKDELLGSTSRGLLRERVKEAPLAQFTLGARIDTVAASSLTTAELEAVKEFLLKSAESVSSRMTIVMSLLGSSSPEGRALLRDVERALDKKDRLGSMLSRALELSRDTQTKPESGQDEEQP